MLSARCVAKCQNCCKERMRRSGGDEEGVGGSEQTRMRRGLGRSLNIHANRCYFWLHFYFCIFGLKGTILSLYYVRYHGPPDMLLSVDISLHVTAYLSLIAQSTIPTLQGSSFIFALSLIYLRIC